MQELHSKVTNKGQVTIPINIRKELGILGGSKLEFILNEGYILLVPVNKSIKSLKGILSKPKVSISLEEMETVVRGRHELILIS